MYICVYIYIYVYIYIHIYILIAIHLYSHTSFPDHLVMREFVSGSPRYHLAIKGVRGLSHDQVSMDDVQLYDYLNSSPSKERQGERHPLPTIKLSVNLVIRMHILLVTVRTANPTPLLLRRSTTPHGPRRASLKKLTSWSRILDKRAFWLAPLVARKRTGRPGRTHVLQRVQ